MSDTTPSYRVRGTRDGASPWRMALLGGGLVAALGAGAFAMWSFAQRGGGSVPLIEADPRPIRVRPADPGGLRVQNQDELIFDRDRRPQTNTARLAPEAEAPRLDALRQQVAPPPAAPAPPPVAAAPPPTARAPGTPAPVAAPPAAGRTTPAAPAAPPVAAPPVTASALPAQPALPPPARPAPPANAGRIQVQIGALPNEESARAEWERLARRAPELLGDRRPTINRFEREGQSPLFRLRTGGFADAEAARAFCEQLRAKGANCSILRP